jgi:hypothetical protein
MRSRVFVNLFAALIIVISLLIFLLVNRIRSAQQAAGVASPVYETPAGEVIDGDGEGPSLFERLGG